jgi:hypothetical protein
VKRTNQIKNKFWQSLWIVMACFCVVFSGAVKKVIQQNADHQISLIIHIDNSGPRLSQNIKDGHRERHEVEQLVVAEHKRPDSHGSDPLFPMSAMHPFMVCPDPGKSAAVQVNTVNFQHEAAGSVPAYLFIHRWQV